ncbi:MAG: hypothetical protein C0510_03160 [Erythrobacter sp.]|nr:hypothetical protein [Erythrobacter sp.]
MGAVRALSRRGARIERERKPKPSPFVVLFGSFDLFVEVVVLPEIEAGNLSRTDMVDVIAALRRWEEDGTWDRPV